MKLNSRRRLLRGFVVLVAVALVAVSATVWLDSRENAKRTVTATFANASPLVAGNEVRLYGVKVGTIDSIALVNGQAQVEMALDEGTPALHRDARAVIRPVSLLGERFVELEAGSDRAPYMTANPVIPASQTSAVTDLDQVLNSLDDPTSASLGSLVTALGEGTGGRGGDAAAAMKALEPAMTETGRLTDVLNQQNQVLNQLIDSANGSVRAVGDNDGKTLDQVVGNAQRTLSTVAANRQALDGALQELPGTLTKARRTLANFGGVAADTEPVLRDIRPVTDDLNNVTGELNRFADAADPALGSLPPVLNKLDGMLDEARPVVDQLGPASRDLRSTAGSVRPIGENLLNHEPGTPSHLENLMEGAANWGMATTGYDGLSHYFRGVVGVTPETVRNMALGALPPLGPLDQGKVPLDPNDPGRPRGPGLLPPLGPVPQLPIPHLSDPLPGLAPAPADPSNATGLAPQQEQSMVEQLLGGGQ